MNHGVQIGTAASTNEDLVSAVKEASEAIKGQCSDPDVVLIFVNHNYPKDELKQAAETIRDAFPNAQTAGGTVNGITYGDERYDAVFANKRAVGLMAFGGSKLKAAATMHREPTSSPREVGATMVRQITEKLGSEPVGGILLGVGLSTSPPVDGDILSGIRDISPRLRLSGSGLCGGLDLDANAKLGFAICDGDVVEGGAILLGLGGAIKCGFSVANGMTPKGGGAFITEAAGPVIKSLNGKPAKEAIIELLGQDEQGKELFRKNPVVAAIERGITLAAPDPEGDFFWCHMPVAYLPDDSAIDLFSPRTGLGLAVVNIDKDSCMNAVTQACQMLEEDANTESFDGLLAFSCALRGHTLGADVAHEDRVLRQRIKAKNQLGIVANGEIGCYRHGRPFFTGWVYALAGITAAD